MTDTHIVIPARMASTRLPGKPLLDIGGKPMIQHVWERARESAVGDVTIATDDVRIADAAAAFGADCMLTGEDHRSGTDRIAEVAAARQWRDVNIVNVQGDEPFIPPAAIRQVSDLLQHHSQAQLATLAAPLQEAGAFEDPNCVKLVTDQNGFALYFSRAPIPFPREQPAAQSSQAQIGARRHVGIYGYRLDALQQMVAAPPCALEIAESLEQLRALWLGLRIVVADAVSTPAAGIDTAQDLANARRIATASAR
ncbi:MAG: 3-deoxy-manno-octulosonate cytidylyltransferase [Pseudomonadota bacterium]